MHLKADTNSIAASAQVLASAADALSAEVDTLSNASQTMRAGWQGDAQIAWTGRHAQMDSTLRHKAATLRVASQHASQYAEDLVRADVAGARAVLGF